MGKNPDIRLADIVLDDVGKMVLPEDVDTAKEDGTDMYEGPTFPEDVTVPPLPRRLLSKVSRALKTMTRLDHRLDPARRSPGLLPAKFNRVDLHPAILRLQEQISSVSKGNLEATVPDFVDMVPEACPCRQGDKAALGGENVRRFL